MSALPIRMTDVADAAKTSIATVSLALAGDPRISPETRRRVQEVSRRLGYRRQRARPRSAGSPGGVATRADVRRLAFLAQGGLDHPMHAPLVQALSEQAAALGVHMEVASLPLNASPDQLVDRARQLGRSVDGLILMGPIRVDALRSIDVGVVPSVLYGYPLAESDEENPPVPIVTSDWVGMGHRATRALVDAGHRRVGFVSGELMPNMWHARCFDGYVSALVHAKLPFDESLVYVAARGDERAGVSAARVFAAMKRGGGPTAYVAVNAGTAGRFVHTMREAGVALPTRDVVVCGYAHQMHEFGLDVFPIVYIDPAKIVAAAIAQLRARCLQQTESNVTVLVPFSSRDLPPAVKSK